MQTFDQLSLQTPRLLLRPLRAADAQVDPVVSDAALYGLLQSEWRAGNGKLLDPMALRKHPV